MSAVNLAAVYADALLELLPEAGRRAVVVEQAAALAAALRASPEFVRTAIDPRTGANGARHLLREAFAGRLDPLLVDWLCLLADRQRLDLVEGFLAAVGDRAERLAGRLAVNVTTAAPCAAPDRVAIESELRRRLGAGAHCTYQVDPTLIGGAVLHYADRRIDGSIRGHLDRLRRLVAAAPTAGWRGKEEPA
jgi:F-type H+-transporting ATPase subunit delta